MTLTWIIVSVAALGAFGGVINSINNDTGLVLPHLEAAGNTKVWMPGWIGNVIVGSAASLLYWALYGPFAGFNLAQQAAAAAAGQAAAASVGSTPAQTVAGLATSFIVGLGGGRVLTTEVDKRLLGAAAAQAAAGKADPESSAAIAGATPRQALQIAAAMPRS